MVCLGGAPKSSGGRKYMELAPGKAVWPGLSLTVVRTGVALKLAEVTENCYSVPYGNHGLCTA